MDSSSSRILSIASKYDTDNIFLIGKGPSIDQADPEVFANGVVLNLNDSERIVPGDICVFHAPWVIESLTESGFKSALYISPHDLPPGVPAAKVDYVPVDQENSELMFQRFNDDKLAVEGVLLVSALKVAKIIADQRMKRQKVYLVGFDFNMGKGYSKRIDFDYSRDDKDYQSSIISAQEHYFILFSYLLRDSNLLIHHVGTKSYSKLSYSELNRRFTGKLAEGAAVKPSASARPVALVRSETAQTLPSTNERHVLITAEITTNHFGDIERLEKMIRRAKDAGADLIKLQKRDVETFYTGSQLDSHYESPFGSTFRDYRNALELDEEGFRFVDKLCKEVGIEWFASILDLPSFHFMQKFGPRLLKLPSTISQHEGFIKAVSEAFHGPVVVSTGLTDQSYEDFIIETFRGNDKLYILQCNSAYPTPPDDCNVAVVRHYHELSKTYPNIRPGYSSHDFGSLGCMLAVAAGARMLEKHVKFGNTEWAHFDTVALDLDGPEFASFVSDIRMAERVTGEDVKKPTETESHKYWARSRA